jgi:hypothetical protein
MADCVLEISASPLTSRPFVGLGVQADGVFYHDECIKTHKLTEADIALFEQRVRQIRPAITRTFVDVAWFNPEVDGKTFIWTTPDYLNLVRMLKLVDSVGGRQNLVCFQPTGAAGPQLPRLIDAMAGLVERLRDAEGIASVHWITLFNEPDSFVPHESPLYRAIFGDRIDKANKTWPDFVAASRYAVDLFKKRGLAPEVRLATPDCVWGHPMRVERMRLAARDFADLDVDFAYHTYNPEWLEHYKDNPNFAYSGMAAETRLFREILGSNRQLVCWEFNGGGKHFGHAYPGVGRYGEDLLGSIQHAVDITDKVMTVLSEGTDGMCLWCIADGPYWPWIKEADMQFGLYRWKPFGWEPKPYWYYYTALCHHLRPGMERLQVSDSTDAASVNSIALRDGKAVTVALINKTPVARTVKLTFPNSVSSASLLRVFPGAFPTPDLAPIEKTEPVSMLNSIASLTLNPHELAIIKTT